MICILCIVIEISRPQASRNTHTHTHTHRRVLILQPMTLIVILLCIAHPNLTYTITSPIVLQLVTHCMHCVVQLVTWNSIVHVTGCKTKTHPHTHTYTRTPVGPHRFLMLLASEPKIDQILNSFSNFPLNILIFYQIFQIFYHDDLGCSP